VNDKIVQFKYEFVQVQNKLQKEK